MVWRIEDKKIILYGCGKMGGALLKGWLESGLKKKNFCVVEPKPSEWLTSLSVSGLYLNSDQFLNPQICVIAVKPQHAKVLLSKLGSYTSKNTLFISLVAGLKFSQMERLLGASASIIRVMPNTPVSIKKGVSCLVKNRETTDKQLSLAEQIFSLVGKSIVLDSESQMDAVTAISGSGPAYVFCFIESIIEASLRLGLSRDLATSLAVATVSGSGALAEASDLDVTELRKNVTSPNGTTEAALKILMQPKNGLFEIFDQASTAAYERSKELGLEEK